MRNFYPVYINDKKSVLIKDFSTRLMIIRFNKLIRKNLFTGEGQEKTSSLL